LTRCPGPQLDLIPSAGLILLIETQCTHAQVLSSVASPLALWGQPMGDYSILCGRLLSEKTAVETYFNMRPGPYALYLAAAGPQSNLFREDTVKKLAWTTYKFNRGLGQQVKAVLLRTNIVYKNRSFKTVDHKNFKYSSCLYLRHKASPNMLFWSTFP
jgi:hypothetical protein